MTNRADTMLLGMTRKTVNIKKDLAERHLKNACVEYYIETSTILPALNQYMLPIFKRCKDTNADITVECYEVDGMDGDTASKYHIGILFIGGGVSWESIPDDLEFHHGSYKLYTAVHYSKAEKTK